MQLLQLEEVSKRFRRGREDVVALDQVTAGVNAGEFVAVVGPSGSGKSTLLHLAGGLDRADRGRVLLDGADVGTLSIRERARLRRRQIGFVFQFFHLLPTLSVRENVELPLLLDGGRVAKGRIDAAVARVGLAERASHLPGELSGGEMQRVAIARALVTNPRLILADEPTGNLDSANGAAVLSLLTEQVREAGASLVMVTHDLDAAAVADRVLHLRDGRLEEPARARTVDVRDAKRKGTSPAPGTRARRTTV